jgi:hypothetical protein
MVSAGVARSKTKAKNAGLTNQDAKSDRKIRPVESTKQNAPFETAS